MAIKISTRGYRIHDPQKVKEQRTFVRCSRLVPSPEYFAKLHY
jgi:hypothetical protein